MERRGEKRRLRGTSLGHGSFRLTREPCSETTVLATAARGPRSAQAQEPTAKVGQAKGQHSSPLKGQRANVSGSVSHMVYVTLDCHLQCKSSQYVSRWAWLGPSDTLSMGTENRIVHHFCITIYLGGGFPSITEKCKNHS